MKQLRIFLLGTFIVALTALTSGVANAETKQAVLAGGCFWCIEHDLEVLGGVEDVKSWLREGGEVENPTYEQVSSGTTGHYEVVQVTYDSDKISYAQLLDAFVENVDPFDSAGQFCDKGQQYKAAIFTSDPAERALAKESLMQSDRNLEKNPQSCFWTVQLSIPQRITIRIILRKTLCAINFIVGIVVVISV